jgi:DNA-binding SARP family transcriptional activator
VDLEAFEAHCRRAEWEEALALYGGDLLPDHAYAEWALAPRERLALFYQRALLAAAEARLAGGHFAQALDACRRLLAVEPWHEQAVLVGMRALVAQNNLAGARRLYLKLAKTLLHDLNTVPQAELQSYYRSLTPRSSKNRPA